MNQRAVLKIEESHPDSPHPKKMLFSQFLNSVLMLLIISCIFFMVVWMSSFFDARFIQQRPSNCAIMLVKQQQEVSGHPVLQGGLPSYFLI